jgi:hypothetical protein
MVLALIVLVVVAVSNGNGRYEVVVWVVAHTWDGGLVFNHYP